VREQLHRGPWPIRDGHNHQPTAKELRAWHLEMWRLTKQARLTGWTIGYWQVVKGLRSVEVLQ